MIKQAKAITWLAGMMFVLSGIFAGEAMAAIAATKHNLSSSHTATGQSIFSDTQTEICVFCHTPHAAIKNDSIPLWNHTLSTTAAYGVYTSPTFDGAGTVADLGGVTEATATASNLCLSCHDGTVAVDSFGGATGTVTLASLNANAVLGTDLSNDHPISITYNSTTAAADGALHDPATTSVTIGAGGDKYRTGTIATVMLSNGTVQCSSCHDVHNSFTVPGAAGQPLLKVSKAGSALCLTCHNK
jgi:hypothetical protein